MLVLQPGHLYELKYHNDPHRSVTLYFVKYRKDPDRDGELILIQDGTTNEEVLAMLIDRMIHLGTLLPDKYNVDATFHLKEALKALEARTADRKARGVEGTHKP